MSYPQPNGALLTAAQREAVESMLGLLAEHDFDRKRLMPLLPGLLETMNAACATSDDLQRMIQEIDGWVRWYRLPGFWLAFLFQLAMQQRKEPYFVVACRLYAQAQINFNQDLALSSFENGYTALLELQKQAASPELEAITADFLQRMRMIYGYYRQWYAPTSYGAINQLTEHLYSTKTWSDLGSVFPSLRKAPSDVAPEEYLRVIDACQAPDDVYCRVLARRFLGSRYQKDAEHERAEQQFALALADAAHVRLDAEIGHLLRLHGYALMKLRQFAQAQTEFVRAIEHESHETCAYWRALSLRELGDCIARQMPHEIDPAHPPQALPLALRAYREGRSLFEAHVAAGVLPIARAVEQQMFRSYADNAVQITMLSNPQDMLAEIEAAGPRYATDVIAEGHAAAQASLESYVQFREDRAVFAQDLTLFAQGNDFESDFTRYVQAVREHRPQRQRYLQARIGLGKPITQAQSSDGIAESLFALRLPGVVFLTFYLGEQQTIFTLIDAQNGQAMSAAGSWTRQEREACHQAYHDAIHTALAALPMSRAALMTQALDDVLAAYQQALGPVFEMLLPYLAGKKLKIVPRMAMHEIPLHALLVGGKRLAEHCDVSYIPTLGAFLQAHREEGAACAYALTVVHDAKGTAAYAGALRQIEAQSVQPLSVLANSSWEEVSVALAAHPPSDVLFACHGRFDVDDPRASTLRLSAEQPVAFSTLFSELDLRACRSVTMGACESGLGRTLVSAEYIGLPLAFLSAGVRYVLGSLWQVNEIASAVLLAHYYRLLQSGTLSVPSALNQAQRLLMCMTQDEVITWLATYLPERAPAWTPFIRAMEARPFAHPLFWAGFYAAGDI